MSAFVVIVAQLQLRDVMTQVTKGLFLFAEPPVDKMTPKGYLKSKIESFDD